MSSLRLGIDLDGVVADFVAGWISRYNQEFEADLTPASVQTWDGLHTLTHFEDKDEFWKWASDHGGGSVFRHLETYEGATDALHQLAMHGHQIVIITMKPDWAVHDTFAWIADHRLPTREVHITSEKWYVPCDVYLDDSPEQLASYTEKRPGSMICRFVRPWNTPVPGVVDVKTWPEFVNRVQEHGARV
jgi:5'(3')-deoxyribonucleotidase